MTGEIQPGDRAPAPGELALVQSFINSHYDLEVEHGADLFATPDALAAWLRRRGLLGSGESLEAADARSAPRHAIAALDGAARGVAVGIRFTGGEPRFVAASGAGLELALGVVLAITARAMIDGSWSRLKVCPGEHCGWAFYDHSRNQSGRWCSMAVCGGRAKARSHYRRHHGERRHRGRDDR